MTSVASDTQPQIRVENTSSTDSGSTALSSVANPRRVRWNTTR